MRNRVRVMCKPGSVGGLGGRPPRSTRPGRRARNYKCDNALGNGGTIENAQAVANHESPKTTKLYDRTSDQITVDEVEKIVI